MQTKKRFENTPAPGNWSGDYARRFPFFLFTCHVLGPIGMKILDFITLYLRTTSDPTTSSILAIFMVGISGSSSMNAYC